MTGTSAHLLHLISALTFVKQHSSIAIACLTVAKSTDDEAEATLVPSGFLVVLQPAQVLLPLA